MAACDKTRTVGAGPVLNICVPAQLFTLVLRYDARCCFNVRSKADMSQLNLPHGSLIYHGVCKLCYENCCLVLFVHCEHIHWNMRIWTAVRFVSGTVNKLPRTGHFVPVTSMCYKLCTVCQAAFCRTWENYVVDCCGRFVTWFVDSALLTRCRHWHNIVVALWWDWYIPACLLGNSLLPDGDFIRDLPLSERLG